MQNSRELNVTHLKRPALVLARKSFLSNDEMTDTLIDLLNAMYPATTTGGSRGSFRAILALLDKNKKIVGTRYIDFDMQLYIKYNAEYLPGVVFDPKNVYPSSVHYGYVAEKYKNNIYNYNKAWHTEKLTSTPDTNVNNVNAGAQPNTTTNTTTTINSKTQNNNATSESAQTAIQEVSDSSLVSKDEGFSYKLYLFRSEDHKTLKRAMSTIEEPVKDAAGNNTGKTRKGVLQEPSSYLGGETPLKTVFVEDKGPALERGKNSELQVIHNPSKIAIDNIVMPEAISKYFSAKSLRYKHSAYVWTFTLKPNYNLLVMPRDIVHNVLGVRKANYVDNKEKIKQLAELLQKVMGYDALSMTVDTGAAFGSSTYTFLENAINSSYNKNPVLNMKNPTVLVAVGAATGIATAIGALYGFGKRIFSEEPMTEAQKGLKEIETRNRKEIYRLQGITSNLILRTTAKFSASEKAFLDKAKADLQQAKLNYQTEVGQYKKSHPELNLSTTEQILNEINKLYEEALDYYKESLKYYNLNSLLYDKKMRTESGQTYLKRLVLGNVTENARTISRIDFKLRYYILLFKKILEKIDEHYQYFIDRGILRIAPLETFNQLKEFLEHPQDIQIILNRNKQFNEGMKELFPSFNTTLSVNFKVESKEELCQLFENILFNPWAGFYISTDYTNKKYNSLYNITPKYNMFAKDTITDDSLAYRNEDIESISISRASNSASSANVSIKNKDEQYYILDSDEARAKYYKYIGTCVFEEMDELMIYLPKYYMAGSSSNTLDLCFRGIVEQVEYTNNTGYHSISLRAKCPIKLLEMSRTNVKPSFSTKNEANSMNNRIPYHVFSMPPEFLNSIPQAIAWMLTQGMTSVFCQPKIFNTQSENNENLLSYIWIKNCRII